jgi:hypothetical protein
MRIIILVCTLLLIITACKKDDDKEFVSYILAVEKDSFGYANLDIQAVVIAPRVTIDTFSIHVTQFLPFKDTVYKFHGTSQPGKHFFHLEGMIQGTSYNYYLSGITFDGHSYRKVISPVKSGSTQGTPP